MYHKWWTCAPRNYTAQVMVSLFVSIGIHIGLNGRTQQSLLFAPTLCELRSGLA